MPRSRWSVLVEELGLLAREIRQTYDGPDIAAHRPDGLTAEPNNPLLEAFVAWYESPRDAGWTDRGTALRARLVGTTAWAIPSREALECIADHGPIVEVGAGTGYWAKLLEERGVDVLAYDAEPPQRGANRFHPEATPLTEVHAGGPEILDGHPDRALMLCWPPPESSMALDCLDNYAGAAVLYIGEWKTSTSATKAFFRRLDRDFEEVARVELPNWPMMSDALRVFRRSFA